MTERSYRIQKAAELSGVSVELIRAWERRYGVLAPERTGSGYRVYGEQDVALLRRLKHLTEEGVAISEAARLVPRLREELARATPQDGRERTETWREALLDAAARMDQPGVEAVVNDVLAALPPVRAFEQVLLPALVEVGERWHAGHLSVAQEHLTTQVIRNRLVTLLHASPNAGARHAVLACLPGEEHEVGLLHAALRLRHAGWRVTVLGPRTPARDLAELVARVRPDLVALAAVSEVAADELKAVVELARQSAPEGARLWAGGAGMAPHAELLATRGARLFRAGDDWGALLG